MYGKLMTPQSRALYHGGLSGGPGGAVSCHCHSPRPEPPSEPERRAGRRLLAACSEVHSFPSEPPSCLEEALIVVSLHFTPRITNEHQPGRPCAGKINKAGEPLR